MEMRKYFKGVETKKADGWILADCFNSIGEHVGYTIDTHSLHADEIPDACTDARSFSRLVAGLLNVYYNRGVEGLTEEQLIELGTVIDRPKTQNEFNGPNSDLPF